MLCWRAKKQRRRPPRWSWRFRPTATRRSCSGGRRTKTAPGIMDQHVSKEHCKVRRCGVDTRPWMEVKVLGAKVFVRRKEYAFRRPRSLLGRFNRQGKAHLPALPSPLARLLLLLASALPC